MSKDGLVHSYAILIPDGYPRDARQWEMAHAERELFRDTGLSPAEHRIMWDSHHSEDLRGTIMHARLVANEHWERITRLRRRPRKEAV